MLLAHAERKQQPAHDPVYIQPSAGRSRRPQLSFCRAAPSRLAAGRPGRGLEPLLRKKVQWYEVK